MTHTEQSAPHAATAAGTFTITAATLDDWPVISGWAADEGWNPGLEDGPAFFAQDPDGFLLGRLDGTPVSAISMVTYGDDYAFLGCYLVRPDQRGRGFGIATWKAALEHAGNRVIGLDGVVAQQDNYRRSGFTLAHRTHRYSGTAPACRPLPAGIVPATTLDTGMISAYDNDCYPADRPGFLRHWLTAPGHRALARVIDGRLTGYGVIRPARDGHRLGPLFADTPQDARDLFDALTAGTGSTPVSLDVPESNPAAVAMAEELGLEPAFETARMYTGPVRDTAGHRVFAVTTLELG